MEGRRWKVDGQRTVPSGLMNRGNAAASREKRRKIFLKKVQQDREEQRWQGRGGDDEVRLDDGDLVGIITPFSSLVNHRLVEADQEGGALARLDDAIALPGRTSSMGRRSTTSFTMVAGFGRCGTRSMDARYFSTL